MLFLCHPSVHSVARCHPEKRPIHGDSTFIQHIFLLVSLSSNACNNIRLSTVTGTPLSIRQAKNLSSYHFVQESRRSKNQPNPRNISYWQKSTQALKAASAITTPDAIGGRGKIQKQTSHPLCKSLFVSLNFLTFGTAVDCQFWLYRTTHQLAVKY